MKAPTIDKPSVATAGAPGRRCPLHYRYGPKVFASPPSPGLEGLDVIYVVGGLYGNLLALERVLELFDRETGRKRLVFNGDFHWFDADPVVFARVQHAVLAHTAMRGNVETEIAAMEAADADAGCGCAYPDWVGDRVVERSNRILGRLRHAATDQQRAQLGLLPMWQRADVGEVRIGIVHGDAESLAGWGFAQEHLREDAHREAARGWLDRAEVDAFACTHTCLPVFQGMRGEHRTKRRWVLNNGAAGMPNFTDDGAGLLTRIGLRPFRGTARRFGVCIGSGPQARVHAEAIAIEIDGDAWRHEFLRQWPAGSDAHLSYFERITRGPAYQLRDAIRIEE
ncbi:MAG TPA: hypothetical protein VEZ89_00875 [Rubrivivax sp.]|nr:hypothetical protein [Rubrivivax sp.]